VAAQMILQSYLDSRSLKSAEHASNQ